MLRWRKYQIAIESVPDEVLMHEKELGEVTLRHDPPSHIT